MASFSDLVRLPVAMPQQIGRDLAAVTEVVRLLPGLLGGLGSSVAGLADDVATLRETAASLHVGVATLTGDLAALGATLDRADARVGRLEELVTSLEGRVVHIDEGLEARIPDLGALPGEVTRIRRDIARVLELTPDPDEPGALEKVRDALTPGS